MIDRLKSIFNETLRGNYEFDETIKLFLRSLSQKNCRFDSRGDVINPKLGQNGSRLVLHVPMVIERWKSMVKGNLRWSVVFLFETTISKFGCFDTILWRHQSKNVSKSSKLVFHVPMLIDRWKSKVKGTLRWNIPLLLCEKVVSKFWSFDLTLWCHQPKIGSKKDRNLYFMY